MSTAETRYVFRNAVPVTYQAGRDQDTAIAASLNGAPATIVSATFTLINRSSATVVNAAAASIVAGAAVYTLDGTTEIPATAGLGNNWQERWTLTMPDGTVRTVRRTAALSGYELHPPVADSDIVALYPDVLDSLGDYATHLQGYVVEGFLKVSRELWRHQAFPYIVVDSADIFSWAREESLAVLFRSLFMSSQGQDERWRLLWEHHRDQARNEQAACRIVEDRDLDGIADSDNRERATPQGAHWNYPPYSDPARLSRKFR